jgi:hypothetical protein
MKTLKLTVLLMLAFLTSMGVQAKKGWKNFNPPKVELEIIAKGHKGVNKYLDLVKDQGYKDIEAWVQHCALAVAQELYYTVEEANAKKVEKITYKLNDGGALSYKDGAAPHIEIGFDLNYLVKFIEKHDLKTAADEVYGVLCHELTHGYQQEPKNCGNYSYETEFFGFIEGTADLARLRTGGFNPPRAPKLGGTYKSGYNVTAFFYLWITKTQDEEFLKKLNLTAKEMETWSLDKALNKLYNASADEWWQHYQQDVDLYPWDNYTPHTSAGFTHESKLLFEGDALAFKNYSKLADAYTWTVRGKEVTANQNGDMAWVFPAKGKYKVQLLAKNTETREYDTLSTIISVMGKHDEFEFSLLGGKYSGQHNDSPKGESPEQLFDGDLNSKFLCFQKEGWVQIEMNEDYILTSYTLTSGNDQPARDPKDWEVLGSVDGENFEPIDKQNNFKFEQRRQTMGFETQTNKAFRYFRLKMKHNKTDDYGSDIIQLAEWSLKGSRAK